jgi:hypothetical protein
MNSNRTQRELKQTDEWNKENNAGYESEIW